MTRKRQPTVDLSRCTDCESCLELCPSVFQRNEETGLIQVAELSDYPEEDISRAAAVCPQECISWDEP